MDDALLVRLSIYGPRPGSGANWLIEGRDRTGATILHVIRERDVAVAALAEYAESLHGIDATPRDSLWPYL